MNPRSETIFLLVTLLAELSGFASSFSKCPPLKLVYGRSRYGWRGRSVRFNCMRPFQLVGAKYAVCMNGKWDADVPICVRTGCRNPSTTHVNGQFIESYRGAVVKIVCNPGYSLVGSSSVYCNGVRWNETFPVCRVKNTNPALGCDFESPDLCGWSQDPMHDFDWKRQNGSTGAEDEKAKQPRFDHTKGENGTGFYMHMESWSRRAENDTGRLYSPVYPAGYSNETCFKFWYQINGPTIGFLKVYVKPEGVELNNLIPSIWINEEQKTWKEAFFQIESLDTPFQIVIEGVRVYGMVGDTAFDDVQLTTGDECKVLEEMSSSSTEFFTSMTQDEDRFSNDPGTCKDKCFKDSNNGTMTWADIEGCGCNETCETTGTCCPDYSFYCSTFVSTTTVQSETKMYSVSMTPQTEPDVRIPSVKPTTESSTTLSTKPTTKPPTNPLTKPPTKPPTIPTMKPTTKPTTKPSTKPTTKPSTKPTPPTDNNNESNYIDPIKPLGHLPNVPQWQPQQTTQTPRHQLPIPKNETFQKPPPVLEKKPGKEKTPLGNRTVEEVPKTKVEEKTITKVEEKAKGKAEVKPKEKADRKPQQKVKEKEKAYDKPQEKGKVKPEEKIVIIPEVESTKATTTTKVFRNKKPSRVNLQNTILEDSSNTDFQDEFRLRMKKPKEVSGWAISRENVQPKRKEPPQAIKVDGENDSLSKISHGLVQFGIFIIAILIIVVFGVSWYRWREQRKTERESMIEDSDVRFLTSDEALDFTLARPADDDL